jgi:hypothetical protein
MSLKLREQVNKFLIEVSKRLRSAAEEGRVDEFSQIALEVQELNRDLEQFRTDPVLFAFYDLLSREWLKIINTKLAEKTPDLFTQPVAQKTATNPFANVSGQITLSEQSILQTEQLIPQTNPEPSFDSLPTAAGALTGTVPNPMTPIQPMGMSAEQAYASSKEFARKAAPAVLPPSTVPMTPPTVVLPSTVPPQVVPNAPEAPAVQPTALKTIQSKDFWACDNDKCGSDDLEFRLSIMTVKQATDSSYVDYTCRACGFKHGALLQREEITRLAELEGSFVNPVTNAPAEPAATTSPAMTTKKPRAKKKGGADAGSEVGGKADAKTFQVGPQKTPEEIKAIVQAVINTPEKEVGESALMEAFRPQIAAWALEKLVKEWEAMTGKTYTAGKTLPESMASDVLRQMAGLPHEA